MQCLTTGSLLCKVRRLCSVFALLIACKDLLPSNTRNAVPVTRVFYKLTQISSNHFVYSKIVPNKPGLSRYFLYNRTGRGELKRSVFLITFVNTLYKKGYEMKIISWYLHTNWILSAPGLLLIWNNHIELAARLTDNWNQDFHQLCAVFRN